MKQKLLNLWLLTVMIIVGSSGAWAETLDATVKMTYVDFSNSSTSYGEIEAGQTAKSGYNKINEGSVGFVNTGWGCNWITYLQVDASALPAGATVTSAVLTFDQSGSTDSKRTTGVGAGYNSSAWSSSMTYDSADKTITTLGDVVWTSTKAAGTFENKEINITAAFTNDADNVVTILLYETAAAGCYIKNPAVTITYSTNPVYAITFAETNNVAATVKINNFDVTNGTSLPDGTYNFTATAAGYQDYSGSFTVDGAAKEVTFTMIAKPIYNYTVKGVDGNGNNLGVVNSGSEYAGNITYYYPEFVLSGTTLYMKDKNGGNPYWGASGTLDADNKEFNVTYGNTPIENVVFYKEAEDIEGFTAKTTNNATIRCSGGTGGISTSDVALTTLIPGKYKLFGQVWGTTGLTASVKIGENTVWELASTGSLANKVSDEFELLTSTDLTVVTTGGNDNHMLDLIYIQRTGEAPMPGAFYTKAQLTGNVSDYVTAAVDGNKLTLTSRVDGLGFEKIKLNLTKGTAAANTGSVSNTVWTGNAKVVELTFDDINNLNSIIINNGTATELPTAATIAAFKATTEETLLTLTGAEVLEKGDDYTIIQDATGGLKLDGIVLDAPKGQKLAGTIAGIYAGNAELVNGTQTDYASPKANGSAQTPTEMTAEEAKTADNIYRLVTLKGVTIRNNGSTITATDKTGSITVDAGTLTLADGDVLASLTGVTYADGLLKATASQSGLLWKADDLAAGQALPVSMTAATYVGKLADVAMGDAITIETLGAGTIEVQNAAGQSIVKYVLTQAENTLHFPVTADMVNDIQKHGLQLVGEGVNAVMAYKLPGLYAANMNENTIWYSDDAFAVGDLITLGAIHFPDVREGDKLENKELTEAEAAFQQDSPYNVISFGAVVDFEKLAVRDDKAEAKEGEEFAQGGYQSTNGMVMSFGGLTEGQSYSFKEAYPAVNKFAAVTEGIDQFPVDNNNKAYDPAQGNVPTKGTFYVFNPTKDGIINVTIDLEKDKKLYVTENGEALNDFKGITKVLDNMISFSVEAGMTYHVFATESNLKYYGFTFTPTYPAAMDVANSIYVFKRLGNVKNAKLMLEDAQVTYIKGDNVFVEDASGAIDLFQTLIQFYVGQKLNGYIFGENIKDFPMLLRTNETPNSQFKAEMGTAQSKTITVAEAKKREAMFRFVTLKNLKQAKDKQGFKVLIDEVGDTIYIEDTFNVLYELPNKIKRIEGIIGFNNGVSYIWPTSKEGVVAEDTPATLATGKYYLKNVGSGLFWGAGNDWGTRGSLLKHAEYVTLIAQGNGIYQMETQVSKGGAAYYFEGDYMDNANPMNLSINKTKTEGIYTIADPNENLFGYDGTSTVLGKSIAEGDNAQWQIISEDEMKATLDDATADNGVDATFLILDPNFGRNNRNVGAWTMANEGVAYNLSGGNNINNCAESYMSTFVLGQEVSVPNGKYVLNAQAAVTFHDDRVIKDYDGNGYPQITANGKVSDFKEMETDDRLSNMGQLSEQFTAGKYAVEPITVYVTDGKLTIGAKSERNDIWAIWDNFELTYYGPASADGVLLQLDFETGEAADYWKRGNGYLVTPDFEGSTGQAASVKNGSDRADFFLTPADFTGVTKYNLDMDLAIVKGSKTAYFAVMSESAPDEVANNWGWFWVTTSAEVHNPYLFEMTIPSGTTATVNEAKGELTDQSQAWTFTEKNWYHLLLNIDANAGTVAYTVTNKADNEVALSGTYKLPEGESALVKGIYERNNRYNYDPGTILIDNVVISTGGTTTAIEQVVTEKAPALFPEGVYNLRGQKVADSLKGLTKGLYIVNGKKIVVK